jgi:hypothetical protein
MNPVLPFFLRNDLKIVQIPKNDVADQDPYGSFLGW